MCEHLIAPKLYEVALDAIKTYLLNFDISHQIALYLNNKGVNKSILSFNLDRDRLEQELRVFYIARIIDNN